MVASSKLGQMQDTIKVAKDEQKFVENELEGKDKMKDAQEHELSSCFGSVSALLDGFPTRHVFLNKLAESFPEPWLE